MVWEPEYEWKIKGNLHIKERNIHRYVSSSNVIHIAFAWYEERVNAMKVRERERERGASIYSRDEKYGQIFRTATERE